MLKKLTRFFWGIVLVPLAFSTLYHLPGACFPLFSQARSLLLILGGVLLYGLFEVLFSRPMRTYVFGHELTHALASLAIGGSVFSFRVSKRGGSVALSKTNFFVALAPYCIPIYTLFVLVIYFLLKTFYPIPHLQAAALSAVGASFAFHISLTLFAIRQEQPDILKTGTFFSLVFILLLNGWILILVSKVLFWNLISLKSFVLDTMKTQVLIWQWIWERSLDLFQWAHARWFQPAPAP